MLLYQEKGRYFAPIPEGMEDLALDELSGLGAEKMTPVYRGIYFDADKETLYRANYRSRLLTRILAPLYTFKCHSTRYLYKRSKEIPWIELLNVDQTFAVFSTVSNSRIIHSQYAALVLKDAIVDFFRERDGKRPGIDRTDPDAWISLHIERDMATVSFDTSGGSLHRRGYRKETVEAPMQEMLAAAIVVAMPAGIPKPKITDWEGLTPEEYAHRCEEDVKINTWLWNKQKKHLLELYGSKPEADKLINYLMFKMDCAREQERTSIPGRHNI